MAYCTQSGTTFTPASHVVPAKNKRRLKVAEKKQIANDLSLSFNNSKLKRGVIKQLGVHYGVSRVTISKIWIVVHKAIKEGLVPNVDRKYRGGNKRYALDLEKVRHIPLHHRTNIRTLACHLNASKSTVHRLVQKGKIRSHSNALKPFLTPLNMEARVNFVLNHIENSSLYTNPTYVNMYNEVHIDEKWFYMTRQSQKYYLLPNEPEPHRTCKSKRFITKIMFMSAIARPRYNNDGVCIFDGKIGIFSFTFEEPALRSSKNRAKGVIEVKPIESINKAVIKQCLQHEKAPKTICQLVDAVVRAYEEVTDTTTNYVWMSLMSCMTEILKNDGNNNYRLPHIGKKKLSNLGQLPNQLTIPGELVQGVLNKRNNVEDRTA